MRTAKKTSCKARLKQIAKLGWDPIFELISTYVRGAFGTKCQDTMYS